MRKHAVIQTAIWSDPDFLARTPAAQRIYLLALSQPNLSYAGVVDYTPRRWALLSAGDSIGKVRRAVHELIDTRFVVVDETTEELLVRSLVRHDRVLRSPNITKALVGDIARIQSSSIRDALVDELLRHRDETSDNAAYTTGWSTIGPLLDEYLREAVPA